MHDSLKNVVVLLSYYEKRYFSCVVYYLHKNWDRI